MCDVLERVAKVADPDAGERRGSGDSDLVPGQQGITVLGTPLGHPLCVEAHLEVKAAEQRTSLKRIPMVPELESAWFLLPHCASNRANHSAPLVLQEHSSRLCKQARQQSGSAWTSDGGVGAGEEPPPPVVSHLFPGFNVSPSGTAPSPTPDAITTGKRHITRPWQIAVPAQLKGDAPSWRNWVLLSSPHCHLHAAP